MGVIRSLHGNRPIPSCAVWTGEADRDFSARALQEHQGKKLLAIGAGANWAGKRWPPEHFLALIERLQQHYDVVVLLGNEKDQKIAGPLKEKSPMPCINLCGKTSLLQAAAVLQKMSLFVGNDSGLGHLASAVDAPSVTVFGPGNLERYRPWGPQARYVTGLTTDINSVSVEDVLAQINKPAAGSSHAAT
jgi:ADP-heptose:LPS heptosyltransferase